MKLYTSGTSPFGRKVKVCAYELGLFDRLDLQPQQLTPVAPSEAVSARNPLGKIPVLITDDGSALFDSRVICEYLDEEAGSNRLFPPRGKERYAALTMQALGDGIMDAAIAIRYELTLRPDDRRWQGWMDGQMVKVSRALAALGDMKLRAEPLDIGTITLGCALAFLDFRFGDLGWRGTYPGLAAFADALGRRPSFEATRPH